MMQNNTTLYVCLDITNLYREDLFNKMKENKLVVHDNVVGSYDPKISQCKI